MPLHPQESWTLLLMPPALLLLLLLLLFLLSCSLFSFFYTHLPPLLFHVILRVPQHAVVSGVLRLRHTFTRALTREYPSQPLSGPVRRSHPRLIPKSIAASL